jgi:hypothetical protein
MDNKPSYNNKSTLLPFLPAAAGYISLLSGKIKVALCMLAGCLVFLLLYAGLHSTTPNKPVKSIPVTTVTTKAQQPKQFIKVNKYYYTKMHLAVTVITISTLYKNSKKPLQNIYVLIVNQNKKPAKSTRTDIPFPAFY